MADNSEEKKLILLDFWPSMFCMRVKIALAEKGITDYECREENIVVGKSSLLLEMNPVHKKIPVLIHNGQPVSESLIIVEYIDELWKDESPNLLPADPYHRSQARFWADFVDKKFFPISLEVWTTKGGVDEATRKEFIDILKTLEEHLGDQSYFGGEDFGFVDIALIPFYSWFDTYEICGDLSIETECPNIIAWAKRCLQKESVFTSVPDMFKVSKFIMDIRKLHGIE